MQTSAIHLQEAYQSRPIRFLELWKTNKWRLKTYGITYRAERPSAALVQRAKELAYHQLPEVGHSNYGVGFIGIHEGRGANFVFIDWWADENELHHHVYVAQHTTPDNFQYVSPEGLIACVWDLSVLSFERQAWVDYVLKRWNAPDVDGYLNCRMNMDI